MPQAKKKAKKAAKKRPARGLKLKPETPDGPRPLSKTDYEFCAAYVQLGKQEPAFRQVFPDHKDAGVGAFRLMQRQEIREHIRLIYQYISRERQKAAELAAQASLLDLALADSRAAEILQTRRRTRGEMLTRDTKQLLVEGATPKYDDNGKLEGYEMSTELQTSLLNEPAPVEDADLLKAIKLTYERKGGIIKATTAPPAGPVNVLLYRPKWFAGAAQKQTPMLEGV